MLLGYMPAKATTLDQWELHYLLSKTPVTRGDEPEAAHGDARRPRSPEAAKLLHDRKLNGVIVVNAQGDLVGILTTTNALEALIHFSKAP